MNLNHGSFGAVARSVHAKQEEYFSAQEARPDPWFRKTHYELDAASRRAVAEYVRASSPDDVVLVENASDAVNSVLRSLPLRRGDVVVRFSTAYNMVTETLRWLEETKGVRVLVVPVEFPMTDANAMTRALDDALRRSDDGVVRLCVFSHVSSFPAVVEPVADLVAVARERAPSALVLVDGAHAPGQIPNLDVPAIGADLYAGNCHKWLYAPKGTAFLWTSLDDDRRSRLEPTVISSSGARDFVGKYAYVGTRDYTRAAAVPEALRFRSDVLGGDDAIWNYCNGLALEVGRTLVAAWGTSWFVPPEATAFMVNVVLPSDDGEAVDEMRTRLYERHGVYLITAAVEGREPCERANENETDGDERVVCARARRTYYVTRLSAQVYLSMKDFEPLTYLVPQLLKEAEEQKTA